MAPLLITISLLLSPPGSTYSVKPDSVYIPITYAGNLILIEGSVNNSKGYFILDSGAPKLVLNKRVVSKSRSQTGKISHDASGTQQQTIETLAQDFQIGDLSLKQVGAYVSDLSNVEEQKGVPLLGLVGVELFTSYEVAIDFRAKSIILTKDSSPVNELDHDFPIVLPFSMSFGKILINSSIEGKKFKMLFDTGAETGVLSREVTRKLSGQFTLQRYSKLITSNSTFAVAQEGILRELTIGDLIFTNLRVMVTNLGQSPDQNFHGVIGHDLLKIGVTKIDFRKKHLTIYPYPPEGVILAETKKATQNE